MMLSQESMMKDPWPSHPNGILTPSIHHKGPFPSLCKGLADEKRSLSDSEDGELLNTSSKKSKNQGSHSQAGKKEKLGDKITALQQLVSPFGKTDTASVLLEAIGYIKFLQDQVQVLSSPYMKSTRQDVGFSSRKTETETELGGDLRSRGLCLVPISSTLNMANNNGADYWASGLGGSSRVTSQADIERDIHK